MKRGFPILFILFIFACSKRYDEDPFTMHFTGLKKRISGEWHMKKILIDGQDFTHLIYMDTVPFYSVYVFGAFRKENGLGEMIAKTYDENFSTNEKDLSFLLGNNSISFAQNPAISVYSYGAINRSYRWNVLQLTKKEMHLQTMYDNQTYDLFFEKSK
jgi:hypothetical protein